MFLHIGNSQVVPIEKVIGIFSLDIKTNQANNQFLQTNSGSRVGKADKKKLNAFIVTTDKIYYSPISPTTLQKRMEKISYLENLQED